VRWCVGHDVKVVVDASGTSGHICEAVAPHLRMRQWGYGFKGSHRDVVGASRILEKGVHGSFTMGRVLPSKVE